MNAADLMVRKLQARASSEDSSNQSSNSLSGLVASLVPILLVATIFFVLFLFLRNRFEKTYRPRTNATIIDDATRRTPSSHKGFWSAITDRKTLPDHFVLQHNSLDGYLFLRFFKLLVAVSAIGCLITWPVLFPVNATGGGGKQQLEILSFANVTDVNRYYAHALVAWVFLGAVVCLVARERLGLIGLQWAYLLSSSKAKRLPSRTVLFMSIPKEQLSINAMKQIFGENITRCWFATDYKKLEALVKDRDKAAMKLESSEMKLIQAANERRIKAEKNNNNDAEMPSTAESWIDKKMRPTHKTKFLIGKKVDTIDWETTEIPNSNKEIAKQQEDHLNGNMNPLTAAFVEFSDQAAAQKAYQLAEKSSKKQFDPRYIDVHPDEVIWQNISSTLISRKAKMVLATAIVTFIILFWTAISAFVGALANINSLTDKVPFLSFIDQIPKFILGVVTGLLPVIVQAVLLILVPIIFRLLARFGGKPTLSTVELKTQGWYFVFQVIQVFLVTTFASGAAAVTTQIIAKPSSAPVLLATNLPKASNFYISYFILYGLSTSASSLLNVASLIVFLLLGKFLDKTPRKQYRRWITLAGVGWGSEYPKWTNLAVIALAYSCIAPLVLGFATIGFSLLYIMFRYQWLFVLGNKVDMKGQAYAKALRQLLWGVYLSSLCLIGLFAIETSRNTKAVGPLVLMIVFLVVVVIFQVLFGLAVNSLEESLPLHLLSQSTTNSEEKVDIEKDDNRRLSNEDRRVSNEERFFSIDDRRIPEGDRLFSNEAKLAAINQGHRERAQIQPKTENQVAENTIQHRTTNDETTEQKKGNFLTQKICPIIHKKFYEGLRHLTFEQPEEGFDYETAYYHPSITAKPPLIWLAKDRCGVSEFLVAKNEGAGVRSTDDYAWLDEKNKVHWDNDNENKVRKMMEARNE